MAIITNEPPPPALDPDLAAIWRGGTTYGR